MSLYEIKFAWDIENNAQTERNSIETRAFVLLVSYSKQKIKLSLISKVILFMLYRERL
jgi:hypothetical protein